MSTFSCPASRLSEKTPYAALTDVSSNWIYSTAGQPLIVELPTSDLGLFEPRDISVNEYCELIRIRCGAAHHDGLYVSNEDGHSRLMKSIDEFLAHLKQVTGKEYHSQSAGKAP